LNAGLRDPQLLEQARPIAFQPFDFGLRASAVIPSVVALGVVNIHVFARITPAECGPVCTVLPQQARGLASCV
jgi:hypothetical protein